MEYLSQFDMTIVYIRGEDNTVADALSCMPDVANTDQVEDVDVADPHGELQIKQATINTILTVSADESFLHDICKGYAKDDFFHKLLVADSSMPGIHYLNGLWYIGDHLIIPCYGTLHEDLF